HLSSAKVGCHGRRSISRSIKGRAAKSVGFSYL
ncbi:hypothetical protein A2U01_0090923, partial [Trifolium medium]|nr:hypothetical protein [Trifolium medium]